MLLKIIYFTCLFSLKYGGGDCVEDAEWKGSKSQLQAIVVSGGRSYDENAVGQVEVIVPKTGQFCSLPPLPEEKRHGEHTMDGLYVCGGLSDNCIHFSNGEWTPFYSLKEMRYGHSSWQTEQGIFLMGGLGDHTGMNAEFVPTSGEQGGPAFSMHHRTVSSCAIPDLTSQSVVVTGGNFGSSDDTVARYDMEGFVEDLPFLTVGRTNHGCGSFLREDGNQVFLVAGGTDSGQGLLSSTEVLTIDSGTWTLATPLPSAMSGLKGVTVDNKLYMTGGFLQPELTDEILEWRDAEAEWGLGVWMEYPRAFHGVTSITLDEEVMKYCK